MSEQLIHNLTFTGTMKMNEPNIPNMFITANLWGLTLKAYLPEKTKTAVLSFNAVTNNAWVKARRPNQGLFHSALQQKSVV
jgi:hypothetical protein